MADLSPLSYPLQLNNQLTLAGVPSARPEYRFHETRKWRLDLAWPTCRIAVEVDGGVFTQGRHTRPLGFIKDLEKLNEATFYGYRVYRFTTDQVRLGQAKRFMLKVFENL